ncbi:hypothetical protein [Thiomicrospira microaerophila]|uniref:hypothetical protein n=1 Tax=Thiomicrospira microaerophila TaxID=406020 RepID=UPI0005CAE993|nr:hypothetical protein [Thiomicrospira microaerophila]
MKNDIQKARELQKKLSSGQEIRGIDKLFLKRLMAGNGEVVVSSHSQSILDEMLLIVLKLAELGDIDSSKLASLNQDFNCLKHELSMLSELSLAYAEKKETTYVH